MNKLAEYAKAVAALLVSAYGYYQSAKGVDTPGGSGVTGDEWIDIVVNSLLVGFAVWGIPNAKALFTNSQTKITSTTTASSTEASAPPEPAPQHAFDDGVAGR